MQSNTQGRIRIFFFVIFHKSEWRRILKICRGTQMSRFTVRRKKVTPKEERDIGD